MIGQSVLRAGCGVRVPGARCCVLSEVLSAVQGASTKHPARGIRTHRT